MKHGFQRAVINKNTTASEQITVPEETATKKARVRGLVLTAAGTVTVELLSATTRLAKFNLIAGVPVVLPLTEGGVGEAWLQCETGEALNIVLGDSVQVDGVIMSDHLGGVQ